MKTTADYLIVGAGVLGLTIAREILIRKPDARITILEKERSLGVHASGRNSGVLHTGIYYPSNTLKAKYCKSGADRMFAYAQERDIPVLKNGKVILATSERTASGLENLLVNAREGDINASLVDAQQIRELEPCARAEFGGIYCEDTAMIDSKAVLASLKAELENAGVNLRLGEGVERIDCEKKNVTTRSNDYGYSFLINTAGAYADTIAKMMGIGHQYQLIPFKGIYYKLVDNATVYVNSNIYPVPDPELPFLGVHITKVISGDTYIGPTAIPALGRENYGLIKGASPSESLSILGQLIRLYAVNEQNFRKLVHQELVHYSLSGIIRSAGKLVEGLKSEFVSPSTKVGIRPQLVNTKKGRLEMDFLMEHGQDSVHILNSISPAFTSSFAVANDVVDQIQL